MIRIAFYVIKRNLSQWTVWDEFFEGYYLIPVDKNGNKQYDAFSQKG